MRHTDVTGFRADEAVLAEAEVSLAQFGCLRAQMARARRLEPLPRDSGLRALPNAILTPHIVGHTIDTQQAGRRNAFEMITGMVAGRAPAESNVRNASVLPAWRWKWAGNVVG